MSWNDLAYMGLTVRPFDGPLPPLAYRRSLFDTPLRRTLVLLTREMENLGAQKIIIEMDVQPRDIRLDGFPRANARIDKPAVRISFQSKHGPLSYATGEYDDWQDNLRAIALSLEALRSVDRYGVSKRGEQYRGWAQIPMSTSDPFNGDTSAAARFLEEHGGYRAAARLYHPDNPDTGDEDVMRKLNAAKDLVGA